jgi:hypothetical protein
MRAWTGCWLCWSAEHRSQTVQDHSFRVGRGLGQERGAPLQLPDHRRTGGWPQSQHVGRAGVGRA